MGTSSPMRYQPADRPVRSVFRHLSLPQRCRLVLGVDLNCSESRYRLAVNLSRTPAPRRLVIGTFGPATVGRRRGRHKRGPDRPQLTDAPIDALGDVGLEHGQSLLVVERLLARLAAVL